MALVLLAPLYEHASPESLALILVLFLIAMHLATPRSRAEKLLSKLPSPPLRLPVIGHLHLIGSLPHRSLCDLARKHGPDVLLLRLGAVPTLVVSSPRAAKAVLRTNDYHFASRPRSAVANILFHGCTNVAFAPYGDYWRQTRKVITTHVLTPSKVRSSRAAREQEVRLVLAKVSAAAAAALKAVDLSEVFSFFANDIVCQVSQGGRPEQAVPGDARDKRQAPRRVQPGRLLPQPGQAQLGVRQGREAQEEMGRAHGPPHRQAREQGGR